MCLRLRVCVRVYVNHVFVRLPILSVLRFAVLPVEVLEPDAGIFFFAFSCPSLSFRFLVVRFCGDAARSICMPRADRASEDTRALRQEGQTVRHFEDHPPCFYGHRKDTICGVPA